MTDTLTRPAASAAVEGSAWRYLLGAIGTAVAVASVAEAVQVAQAAVIACGPDADDHLRIDLRADRVELCLQTIALGTVTDADIALSRRITDAVSELGRRISGVRTEHGRRSLQTLEIAIDAMDIAAIRPFWKAVLGYVDEPEHGGPTAGLIDPAGQGPPVWFQQMAVPRPQRNRIHFDLTVPHDEAEARIRAALDAGGVLVSDARARAFWILADGEGNEVCVCTWQDRD